ncbi:MAG TPA: serine/threonine-protein kinase, partial [Pirellulales bacterium]
MPQFYTCSAGHQWASADGVTTPFHCPVCGDKPSSVVDAAPGTTQDASPRRPVSVAPVIAGYEILGELGRGGMGVVYKARQTGLNRIVALKMILTDSDAGPAEISRFRAEAAAVARLQHPNIVQIIEVGENQGRLFFSLEYMDGGGLNHKLGRRPQPPREAAALVETLARAIHHAHQRGVVHRDLKPANVLLTADGTPKIADFGLAKYLDVSGQTAVGAVLGTASYMAPEQAQGQNHQVGPAADIWALGVILYEMLTGRPPFRGDSLHGTLAQVLNAEPPPPRQLSPDVPAALQAICLRCLRKDPVQRYPSAAA